MTQIFYAGAAENEPLQHTLYHGDGSVFDGTGYTPSFALRLEFDSANAFTASGAGVVDWVSAAAGTVLFTPSAALFTSLVPGVYIGQWVATIAGRTKHFAAGRFEMRKAF